MRGLWGETQAGGHGSPGDRAWEGPGWRVTELMGSRVSGSRVPGGPQLVLCAVGVLSGGAVPEALPRGPVTGLVQGPRWCPGDRLCFLHQRLP